MFLLTKSIFDEIVTQVIFSRNKNKYGTFDGTVTPNVCQLDCLTERVLDIFQGTILCEVHEVHKKNFKILIPEREQSGAWVSNSLYSIEG